MPGPCSIDLVMDKISGNTELRKLSVYLPKSQSPFPLIAKVTAMFRNNRALRMLTLKVPVGHFELPLLRQLMRTSSRFQLKTEYAHYLSDASDEGSDESDETGADSERL